MTIQFLTDSPFSSSVGSRPNPCLLDLVTDSRLYLPLKGLSTLWIPVFDWEYSPNSPCWLSLKASLNVSLVIVFSSNAWVAQSPRKIGIIKYLFRFSPIFSLVIRAWGEIKMTKIVSIIPSLFPYQLNNLYFEHCSQLRLVGQYYSNLLHNKWWHFLLWVPRSKTESLKLSFNFCHIFVRFYLLKTGVIFWKKTAFCQRSTLTSINLDQNIHM